MNDIVTEWIGPLLWCLALFVAAAGLVIYVVQICPGVKTHTFMTKLICPYFIVAEFKKVSREAGASLTPYYAYWFCFAAPLGLIILAMLCDMAK